MSYDTVKSGIVEILNGLGFSECKNAFDFENVSTNKYKNSFIIMAVAGELDEAGSETLSNRIYDFQTWQIQIAFERSSNSVTVNADEMHRQRERIIAKVDNPNNWSSFVRLLKYTSWEVEILESYFVLKINVKIQDTVTHT